LSFYLYKKDNKLIFYIQDGFWYELEVGSYIPISHPVPVFWNRKKPKLITKSSQNGKKFGFSSGGYPRVWALLPGQLIL